MKKIATPHFDFESRKAYIEPRMEVVLVSSVQPLLAGSVLGDSVLDENAGPDIPGLAPPLETPDDMVGRLLGIPSF